MNYWRLTSFTVAFFEEMYVDLVTTWNKLQTRKNTKPLVAVGFSLTSLGFAQVCWQYQLISFSFRPFTFDVCISLAKDVIVVELPTNQSINLIKGKHITAEADKPKLQIYIYNNA